LAFAPIHAVSVLVNFEAIVKVTDSFIKLGDCDFARHYDHK